MKHNSTHSGYLYENAIMEKDNAFYLYGFLTVLRCVMNLVKFYALLMFCRTASLKLHEAMASKVIGTTMAFFDNYYIGNILNRFSYDLNTIDEFLPILFPILGAVSLQIMIQVVLHSKLPYVEVIFGQIQNYCNFGIRFEMSYTF